MKKSLWLLLLIALSACGGEGKEDKAQRAVKEAVTREFEYYKGAKEKLGETETQERQRREQEKQLE